MRSCLFAFVLLFCPRLSAPAAADAGLAGYWDGEGQDEDGRRYEIEIAIGRDGRASFEYRPLDAGYACSGTLTLMKRENGAFSFRDAVSRGPAQCLSYGRVTLKPRGDGTWLSYDRLGGGAALRGELRGFRLTVKPETCAECAAAEAQDEIGCRYLSAKERRDSAADKACLVASAAFAKECRAALNCPAAPR